MYYENPKEKSVRKEWVNKVQMIEIVQNGV